MEKRSSMRSWRERGGKVLPRGELIGVSLIALIFIGLIASSFFGVPQDGNSTSPEQLNKTAAPTPAKASNPVLQASIPAPSIRINSPENTTYNTSTPPLDFIVAGSGLDSVLLSVDDGPQIAVPHDGTVAKIDFARLNPLFIDDFSGSNEGLWTESGSWRIDGGKYITTGGVSSFGNSDWDNYIVEVKTRLISGNDISIDQKWNSLSNFYALKTGDAYDTFVLNKVDDIGFTNLFNTQLSNIDSAGWHNWRIIANGSKIQAFIDGTQYIDYTDNNNPYLKGNLRLRVTNSNAEYDYIHIYKPLLDGEHKLTIFANNTAGNSSSQIAYFTINTTLAKVDENIVGKIGVPFVKNGFEVTVKSATPWNQYTNVWLSIKNLGNEDKILKLGPGNIVIDSKGQQYESINIPKSKEITQTNLYPQAMVEGGIYFDKITDGSRSLKRLVLYVNGEKLEFALDVSKS
ncbi:MAG: hypothetical protein OIN66_11865 [Candidatus Methanoperedens sp.]|nr:hypothetical protein [Candidatus Methanoperedens sp.]